MDVAKWAFTGYEFDLRISSTSPIISGERPQEFGRLPRRKNSEPQRGLRKSKGEGRNECQGIATQLSYNTLDFVSIRHFIGSFEAHADSLPASFLSF